MAVRKFGVSVVIEGVGKFITDMGRMQQASAKTAQQMSANSLRATMAARNQEIANLRVANSMLAIQTAAARLDTAIRRLEQVIAKQYASQAGLTDAERAAAVAEYQRVAAENELAIAINNRNIAANNLTAANNQETVSTLAAANAGDALTIANGAAANATSFLGAAMGATAFFAKGMAIEFKLVESIVGGIIGTFAKLAGGLVEIATRIAGVFDRVFEITGGILFAETIRRIGMEIRNLSADVLVAVSDFQRLQIQFTALAARDISQEMGISFGDAMQYASVRAQGLLQWVQQLAVTTPFTVKKISETVALGNAMGMTTGQAMELTKAVVDFSSGMGLTEEHMYRIVYNMGQMIAIGKLTGREFRDLSTSFVPVWEILGRLGKEMGKSTAEMKQLAFTGGVPVEDFFKEFIKLVGEDFPGAAEKMAHTFTGVMGNLRDFFEVIIGTESLGPAFDQITKRLADGLDKLLTPAVRNAAHLIGEVLGRSMDETLKVIEGYFIPAVKELGVAFGMSGQNLHSFLVNLAAVGFMIQKVIVWIASQISNLAKIIATGLTAPSKYAGSWGYNLIASFAKGMAQAVGLIVKVITFVANLISSLFKSKSPPKILPHIDDWGKNTMQTYFDAFADADPSKPLKTVADKVAKDTAKMTGTYLPANANLVDTSKMTGTYLPKNWEKGYNQAASGAKSSGASTAQAMVEAVEVPLSYYMQKVLKQFRQFGADAMTALTAGWTPGTFDIFNQVADQVEEFLRALPAGTIKELDLIPRILGTRRSIAEAVGAVRDGLITVDKAVQKIMATAKDASKEFGTYIRSLFDVETASYALEQAQDAAEAAQDISLDTLQRSHEYLARMSGDLRNLGEQYVKTLSRLANANNEVEISQAALTFVTDKYKKIIDALNKTLDDLTAQEQEVDRVAEINAAIQSGLLTDEERTRLEREKAIILLKKQIRQTEDERDASVGAAEDRVKAAKALQDQLEKQSKAEREQMLWMAQQSVTVAENAKKAAEDQMAAAQATIEMQIKQNELMTEQAELLKNIADEAAQAASAAGGAAEAAEELIGEWAGMGGDLPTLPDISAEIDKIFEEAKGKAEQWSLDIQQIMQDAFKDVKFEEMKTSLNQASTNLSDWYNNSLKPAMINAWALIKTVGGDMGLDIKGISDHFSNIIEILVGAHAPLNLRTALAFIGNVAFMELMRQAIALSLGLDFVEGSLAAIERVVENMKGHWDEMYEAWKKLSDHLNDPTLNPWTNIKNSVVDAWAFLVAFGGLLIDAALGPLETILGGVKGWRTGVTTEYETLARDVYGHSIVPDMMQGVEDEFKVHLDNSQSKTDTVLGEILTTFADTFFSMDDEASTHWGNISSTTSTETANEESTIDTFLSNVWSEWSTKWGLVTTWAQTVWSDTAGNITYSVRTGAEKVSTFITGKGGLVENILKLKTDALEIVQIAGDTFGNWLGQTFAGYLSKFKDGPLATFKLALQGIATLLDNLREAKIPSVPKTTPSTEYRRPSGPGRQFGGFASAGRAYAVGERGTELFVPGASGYLASNARLRSALSSLFSGQVLSQGGQPLVYNQTVNINIDANYAQAASQTSIYYDVQAALAAAHL